MQYKIYTKTEKVWDAMREAIENANSYVLLEMYIFLDDIHGFDFSGLLEKKARSGVKVKMVLDSFGSSNFNKRSISRLKESGVEILFFSHFFHRTHRKILVVDQRVAFIGGVNVHRLSSHWDDLAVRVSGPLVQSLFNSFAKVYINCGGKDPFVLSKNKKLLLGLAKDWIIEHSPIKKKFGFKKLYKNHIRDAEKKVLLVTPYFTPRRWLFLALHHAVLRGVKVEVIITKKTDLYFLDKVNYFYISKLSRLGVDFYLYPRMNHAKAMVIDEREVVIGSQNLDYLSFELNSEVGVFFTEPEIVKKFSDILEGWKGESILFDPQKYKAGFMDRVFAILVRLLFFL